jgi:hypothetical protein
VSERDRFWLDHQTAQAASGRTAKDYAAVQGLSPHAFYQARKRLRGLGLLASPGRGARVRKPSRSKALSFSKVTVTPVVANLRFRVSVPGGAALEWSGGEVPESVMVLLEHLARAV